MCKHKQRRKTTKQTSRAISPFVSRIYKNGTAQRQKADPIHCPEGEEKSIHHTPDQTNLFFLLLPPYFPQASLKLY
jgi:hypothetical protein